jgi:hypothetical protein
MVSLLLETWRYFVSHDGRLLSGAIAFYASLAIAPLGVVALLIASLVMPEAAAREQLVGQIEVFLGPEMAAFLVDSIVRLGNEAISYTAPVLGALFMLYISQGEHETAHFAICTGFMALGMMLPGLFSGWLQEALGYQHFFVWVLLATIPSFIVVALIPLDAGFGRKETVATGD